MSHSQPTLGEALYWRRVELNIRLRDLACEIGIPAATLSDIEHGRRMPAPGVLEALLRRLGGLPAGREEPNR